MCQFVVPIYIPLEPPYSTLHDHSRLLKVNVLVYLINILKLHWSYVMLWAFLLQRMQRNGQNHFFL
jgi:hypothetical protein